MLGTKDQPGITFLTLMDLYQRIEAIKSEKVCEVAVSYLEVMYDFKKIIDQI